MPSLRSWCLLPLFGLACQAEAGEHRLMVELAGSGGLGSVNLITPLSNTSPFDVRVGLSVFPIDRNNGWVIIVPVLFEAHTSGNLQAIGGVGQGLSVTTHGIPHTRALVSVGGRYVFTESKLSVGLRYTPLISFLFDQQVEHWFGAQLGFRL